MYSTILTNPNDIQSYHEEIYQLNPLFKMGKIFESLAMLKSALHINQKVSYDLKQITPILQHMHALVVSANNGALNDTQLSSKDDEFHEYMKDLSTVIKFDYKLLNNSAFNSEFSVCDNVAYGLEFNLYHKKFGPFCMQIPKLSPSDLFGEFSVDKLSLKSHKDIHEASKALEYVSLEIEDINKIINKNTKSMKDAEYHLTVQFADYNEECILSGCIIIDENLS